VPDWVAGRGLLAYAAGAIEVAAAAALLFRRTSALAARVWILAITLARAQNTATPQRFTDERALRVARIVFGLAGVALVVSVLPRLGAVMEAAAEPHSRREWTMLCIAMVFSGAAWSTARSYRAGPRGSPGF